MTEQDQAGEYVNEHYRKVAARWRERVTDAPFMRQLRAGTLPMPALRTFFKNWGSYTIEINTVEAASYHKHISFFRKHRDLMARMAEKLADELIHPKPPGHVHVVVETAKALGISEDEIFMEPMLAEFRAKLDFKRSLLWEGTMSEFYTAGATEEQTGYWSAEFFKSLTTLNFFINASSEIRHPTDTEGKTPKRFPFPSFEEPSLRTVAPIRYLSLKL